MKHVIRLIVLVPLMAVWVLLSIQKLDMQQIPWQLALLAAATFGKEGVDLIKSLMGKAE